MAKDKTYGIDRAVLRWKFERMPVCLNTIKKWRREDPCRALSRLVKKAGSQAKLAELLGVSQKTISTWLLSDVPLSARPAREPGNAVERAVLSAGGQPKVAALFGVTQQCVSGWCKKGYMPPARAQEMEMQTGVPRTELINPKLRNTLGVGGEL